MTKRILFIEDEFLIAKDIQLLLQKDEEYQVDVAKTPSKALELYQAFRYDLVISDINLQCEKDGIEVVKDLKQIRTLPVIYLTAYKEGSFLERAKKTMPFAYLLKPFQEDQLKVTIQLALLNYQNILEGKQEDEENTKKIENLTTREKEVLITLATGKTSKEIADTLCVSYHTVEKHKKNIKEKLGFHTIAEMVNFTFSSKLYKVY
ncbi:DNA-binding response regulator [Mesonia ostreae]|uniref:Response regulator n=1 Tax=Mesonia ostreae TaxID=861110 RepID=A0ABU2KL63_9FLAO|nr:response regulator [Mesonia ostreae]MDT0295409.1 response regulator [Mesonia ostreae]